MACPHPSNIRRHGDEFGLHPPAGGIFRIFQAALERIAFRLRKLFEDFLLVLLVEALQQLDRIVGLQFANALGNRLRLEFLKDFLADGIVDFVQRREVEIGAGEFHQPWPLVRIERFDQVAEVSLMEFGDNLAQKCGIAALNRPRDPRDEFGTDIAVLVAHRVKFEHRIRPGGGVSHIHVIAIRRLAGLIGSSALFGEMRYSSMSLNLISHQALAKRRCQVQ